MMRTLGMAAVMALIAGTASAQPTITSLGTGSPAGVTNGGTHISAGGVRWIYNAGTYSYESIAGFASGGGMMSTDGVYYAGTILNNPQVSGNNVTTVSPAWSIPTSFTPAPIATTANIAARWNANTTTWTHTGGYANNAYHNALMCFGIGNSGSTINDVRGMSANGQFMVGQTYISSYNGTGTAISVTAGRFRPYVWNAAGNGGAGEAIVLPTGMTTSLTNNRIRDGRALAVSADGSVIVGGQEPNQSTSFDNPNPDGGRPIVWRWNTNTAQYEATYLPDYVRSTNGNPITRNVDSFYINAAGTIIVGTSGLNETTGGGIAKWTWNAGTSTWDRELLGGTLAANPAWLPPAVTSCGLPPTLTPTGMTEDGSVIVGFATWSTCGSFMRGGWIWHQADGQIKDWYEYCQEIGVPNVTTEYGPIDIDNNPVVVGLPRLGNPSSISPDGQTIIGWQGGNQIVIGAVPWVLRMSGGPSCVAPFITTQPSNTTFTRCSSLGIILNARAGGTLPITYQWYRNGQPLANGPTGNGSTITGATGSQLRVNFATAADAGDYHCVMSGCNAQSVSTTVVTAALDSSIPAPANDICSTATAVGEGTHTFNICNAWADEGFSQCITSTGVSDNGDVWYRYTPTFTGEARFQTCASSFNTTLMILDDCGPSAAVLACNDDVGARGLVGTSCNSARSLISRFPVTQGVPVLIRVGALGVPTGTGSLSISVAPPIPANDDCASATPIGMGPTAFNLGEATDDGFNFGCATGGGALVSNRDLWYRLVSDCGGTYTIATCGSTISNPMIHVFDSCHNLNLLACNDNVGSGVTGCTSNQARIVDLTITGDVLIRVSASGAGVPSSGAGTLTISGTPLTQCCDPDVNCDGATNGVDVEIQELAVGGVLDDYCQPDPDFNGDGAVNGLDVEAVELVVGGAPCP
ncbi:MAG: hypothetical protein HBSAPP03_20210 [Phycisphaerae bacterium]|nr:MAG: hypothetical protein HBSAPP03_20210 [Phycisphaerae bacterium]